MIWLELTVLFFSGQAVRCVKVFTDCSSIYELDTPKSQSRFKKNACHHAHAAILRLFSLLRTIPHTAISMP